MGDLNLVQISIELLQINERFSEYINNPYINSVASFELHTFEQIWGSTSGGFDNSIGGSAMTTQRTYVFIPKDSYKHVENCLVYFGSRFAYSVPYSDKFMKDVVEKNVKGISNCDFYL